MWQQLKIQVESENAVKLEEKLLEAGAISISFLDAKEIIRLLEINKEYNKTLRLGYYWESIIWNGLELENFSDGYKLYRNNTKIHIIFNSI